MNYFLHIYSRVVVAIKERNVIFAENQLKDEKYWWSTRVNLSYVSNDYFLTDISNWSLSEEKEEGKSHWWF